MAILMGLVVAMLALWTVWLGIEALGNSRGLRFLIGAACTWWAWDIMVPLRTGLASRAGQPRPTDAPSSPRSRLAALSEGHSR